MFNITQLSNTLPQSPNLTSGLRAESDGNLNSTKSGLEFTDCKQFSAELTKESVAKEDSNASIEKSRRRPSRRRLPAGRRISRRKHHLDTDEIAQAIHRLTPMYRRKIFFEQLKSWGFVILIPVLLAIGISVGIPVWILSGVSEQIIEVYLPPVPLLGSWGVIQFNATDGSYILDAIQFNETSIIAEAEQAVEDIYNQAGVPVKNVTLYHFKNSGDKRLKRKATVESSKILDHTVYLNENRSQNAQDVVLNLIIKRVRKLLANSEIWLVDPNQITLRQGKDEVQASSLSSFLEKKYPPLDLLERSSRIQSTVSKTSCRPLKPNYGGEITPEDCKRKGKPYVGIACTLSCHGEKILTGSWIRTCLSNGLWSGMEARCEQRCPPLQNLQKGDIYPNECIDENSVLLPGIECFHYCPAGYKLIGSFRTVCNQEGRWTFTTPVCKRTCLSRHPPLGGHVVPVSCATEPMTEGSLCTFYCKKHYLAQGELTATCDSDGSWTSDVPVCRKMCRELPEFRHGSIHPVNCKGGRVYAGVRCTFTCERNYALIGPRERSCDDKGVWTSTASECIRVCPALTTMPNVIVHPTKCKEKQMLEGDACRFSCETGSVIEGTDKITCQGDGQWNKESPECLAVCIELPKPEIGDLICSGSKDGATCALLCSEGYILSGTGFAVCQKDGTWSEPLGICQNTCPKYTPPFHGKVIPTSCAVEISLVGAICSIQCDIGYGIMGSVTTECLADGTWKTNSSHCQKEAQYILKIETTDLNMCLTLETETLLVLKREWMNCITSPLYSRWSILNNRLIRNSDTGTCLAVKDIAAMSFLEVKACNNSDPLQVWEWPLVADSPYAFKLKKHGIYVWEGYTTLPYIVTVKHTSKLQSKWLLYNIETFITLSFFGAANGGSCPPLRDRAYGRWSPSSCTSTTTKSRAQCTFICSPGYEASNSRYLNHCTDGKWSHSIQEIGACIKSCQGFSGQNSKYLSLSPSTCTDQFVKLGTTCSASCQTGNVFGEQYVVCLNEGVWSHSLPSCVQSCPPLAINGSGIVSHDVSCRLKNERYEEGSVCTVECTNGYVIQNSPIYHCKNGAWGNTDPVCKRKCSSTQTLHHGTKTCDSNQDIYVEGESCSIQCDFGYIPDEAITRITCLPSGLWSANIPNCERLCPPLESTPTLHYFPSSCLNGSGVQEGTMCGARCIPNYNLVGSHKRICQASGKWSGAPSSCVSDMHFLIWQTNEEGIKVCLVVEHFPYHNIYKVILENFALCNKTDPMHIWFFASENQISNVATRWCLAAETLSNSAMVELRQCDANREEQEWTFWLRHGHYVIATSSKKYYLRSISDRLDGVEISSRFDYTVESRLSFEWFGIDSLDNDGSVPGMAPGIQSKCPRFDLPTGAVISPNNCNYPVEINQSCSVTCDKGPEIGTPDTGTSITCLDYGKWSVNTIDCSYIRCPLVSVPAHSFITDISCVANHTETGSTKICKTECYSGFERVSELGSLGYMQCLINGEWSESVPKCLANCSALEAPDHGYLPANCTDGSSIRDAQTCQFSCNFNYGLVGDSLLVCQDGVWSHSVPTCKSLSGATACLGLSSPDNGQMFPSACLRSLVPDGTQCSVECNEGFLSSITSFPSLVCQSNGEWSAKLPQCKRKCRPFINKGFISIMPARCVAGNNTVGEKCIFECPKSYGINGKRESICQQDGVWSSVKPTCISETQFLIKQQESGRCLEMYDAKWIATSNCQFENLRQRWSWFNGRQLRNVKSHLCLEPDSESSISKISGKLCSEANAMQDWECSHTTMEIRIHGKSNIGLTTLGGGVGRLYAMRWGDPAVEQSGMSYTFTGENEMHRGTICSFGKYHTCPSFSAMEHGYVEAQCSMTSASIVAGKRCRYFCDLGYKSNRIAARVCQSNGHWNIPDAPACRRICLPIKLEEQSSASPKKCSETVSSEGEICTMQCASGFTASGNKIRICQANGKWSGVSLICHKPCPPVGYQFSATIKPAHCTLRSQDTGSVCTTVCNDGYEINSIASQICHKDGTWSSTQGMCLRTCPPLPPISFGRVVPSDCLISKKKAGDACIYSCSNQYGLTGSGVRVCGHNGIWNAKPPSCLRSCRLLESPDHGYVVCVGSAYIEGVSCKYICNPGYKVEGDSRRTCLRNGEWSGEKALCASERQFLLLQSSPPESTVCIFAEEGLVKTKPYSECSLEMSSHRWAWYGKNTIHNVDYDMCLTASNTKPEKYLMLAKCDEGSPEQMWQCSLENHKDIIFLAQSHLIPVFSTISTTKILLLNKDNLDFIKKRNLASVNHLQWYAKTTTDNRTSVCTSREVEVCTELKLTSFVSISPAVCSQPTVPIGIECHFTCSPGYILKGSAVTTVCLNSGYWTNSVPVCIKSCPALSIDKNVRVLPSSCKTTEKFPEGHSCRYSCAAKYVLIGISTATCMANGKWSSQPPECHRICSTLNAPMHGSVEPKECSKVGSHVSQGTECKYICHQIEHAISRSRTRFCTRDGTWSGYDSECIKPCFPLQRISNAVAVPSMCTEEPSLVGTICSFTCFYGFLPTQTTYRSCLKNGSWSGRNLICQTPCRVITVEAKYGVIYPSQCTQKESSPGYECNLKCLSGYDVIGYKTTTCLDTGEWSRELGQCSRKCPKLNRLVDGHIEPTTCLGGDIYEGLTCVSFCHENHILQGSNFRTCLNSGLWTGIPFSCVTSCSWIPYVLLASVIPSECTKQRQTVNSVCEIRCHPNTLTKLGQQTVRLSCLSSGFWSTSIPSKCIETCLKPAVLNGRVSCEDEEGNPTRITNEGAKCTVLCDPYHVPIAHPTATCTKGKWIPSITTCEYVPYPMLLIQRIGTETECVGLRESTVVMHPWELCKEEVFGARWMWKGFSIVNINSGLCLTAVGKNAGHMLTVMPCGDFDSLQNWQCDENEPYKILLSGTSLSPSKKYAHMQELTLEISDGPTSMFYTFNPASDSDLSTICSRMSRGGCRRFLLDEHTIVMNSNCNDEIIPVGTSCPLICLTTQHHVNGAKDLTCTDTGLWFPERPGKCEPLCPLLFSPAGAGYYIDITCVTEAAYVGQECELACQPGYALSRNNSTRKCLSNGTWTPASDATCMKLCPAIEKPKNAVLYPEPCVSGDCKIECNIGYRLKGPRMRTCQETGKWSEPEFSCIEEVQFSIVTKIAPLRLSMCLTVKEKYDVGKEPCGNKNKAQKWKWRSHLTLENVRSGTCLAIREPFTEGRLSTEKTLMEKDEMGFDEMINYDSAYFRNSSIESDVSVVPCNTTDPEQQWECDSYSHITRYRLRLASLRLYLDSDPQFSTRVTLVRSPSRSAHWFVNDYSGISTLCSKRTIGVCSPLLSLYGGQISPPVCSSKFVTVGTICYFVCDKSFVMEGKTSATCKKNGLWTGSLPFCLGIDKCVSLKISPRVKVSPPVCLRSLVTEGKRCHFSCEETQILIGPENLLCQNNGTWEGQPPTCNTTCSSLPPPINGFVSPESCLNRENAVGSNCTFHCEVGYDVIGPLSRKCERNGQWSGSDTVCRKLCSPITLRGNSVVTPETCLQEKSSTGGHCKISCVPGHELKGKSQILCRDGVWSDSVPLCVNDTCVRLPPAVAGVAEAQYTNLVNDAVAANTILSVICQSDFYLIGSTRRVCLPDGSWSGAGEFCAAIKCRPLLHLYHGRITPGSCHSNDGVGTRTLCSYSCEDGYILNGSPSTECLSFGKWSEDKAPQCHDTRQYVQGINFLVMEYAYKSEWWTEPEIKNVSRVAVNGTQSCIGSTRGESKLLELSECFPVSPFNLWRWYGSSRLQNVANQLCWDVDKDNLVLQKCDLNVTSQVVSCGDISSPSARLQLTVEAKLLGHTLQTTRFATATNLNWIGMVADYSPVRVVTELGEVFADEIPICTYMCGGNFSSEEGDLSTPNFPSSYPPDLICKWSISVPGKVLYIDFSEVGFPVKGDRVDRQCYSSDYLTVHEGTNGNDKQNDRLEKTCVNKEAFRVKSLHGSLHVELYSDHLKLAGENGFTARWYSKDVPPIRPDCGISDITTSTPLNSTLIHYPWQVALVTWKLLCDGTLIHWNFVITSAHCVEHIHNAEAIKALVIAYGFSSQSDLLTRLGRRVFDYARKLWIHPAYDTNMLWNNIAVIMLTRGVSQSNDFFHPICLQAPFHGRIDRAGLQCVVSGFSEKMLTMPSPNWRFTKLEKAMILSKYDCRRLLQHERGITSDNKGYICAEIFHESWDSRPLRSATPFLDNSGGSVLQCVWNGNWYAVGISNFYLADKYKVGKMYRVFSSVNKNYDWIDKIQNDAYLEHSNVFT